MIFYTDLHKTNHKHFNRNVSHYSVNELMGVCLGYIIDNQNAYKL